MAKRERFTAQKDKTERHRNTIVYVLAILGILGSLVGLILLPEQVSINLAAPNAVARSKEMMVGLHFGMIALFTALFWKWPRELVYLAGAVFGVVMLFFMLYNNLGV